MKTQAMIITGSRAEYGLLKPLIEEVLDAPDFELSLTVTGSHLSESFGNTISEIKADQIPIAHQVPCLTDDNSRNGIGKSLATVTAQMSELFSNAKPDLIFVLGDRYEILGAAQAALIHGIPIAHIHGGEVTEGAFDDAIRHSITKMSQFHFVAAESYRTRVIQMGESPSRVWNVGAIGLSGISDEASYSREELARELDFSWGEKNFLVTYHPETLRGESIEDAFQPLLDSLSNFPQAKILFTKSNADPGGIRVGEMIDQFVKINPDQSKAFFSLGRKRYLSAVRAVDVVIGNSSSGIIEVPALRKPTVNIGDRQKGRLRARSIIDCGRTQAEITQAIEKTLDPKFLESTQNAPLPYGEGKNSAKAILEGIRKQKLYPFMPKSFFDQPGSEAP